MIHLTPYEQRMLDGEFGAAKQVALQKIIDYAQILGATELVPITKAHLCCGSTCEPSDFPDGNLDRPDILAMGYHDWQTKLKCPGLDPAAFNSFNETTYVMDDVHCCDTFQWQWTQQTKEFYENNRQILSDAADRGVMIGSTCAPYLAGWLPVMGEYFVTTESSNVLYSNSILGARGNGGGGNTTFCSAICGRAPKWGLHLPENRHSTHVFHVACDTKDKTDWDLLGAAVGRRLAPNAVPVICGDFERPDLIKLKSFFTALAVTSGCELCLIVGVSPEAQTYEMAMGGHEPAAEFTITNEILQSYWDEICCKESGPADYLQIGCPNCSAEELIRIWRYMHGRKVKEGVRFCVFTNIAQYAMAEQSHIIRDLKDWGVEILTSGCILRTINVAKGAKSIGLSSFKLCNGSKDERDCPIYYGTDEQVIDAAISGYWEVKRRYE